MDIDLKNRKVVITGVSEGIGRSLALAFGEAGAKVAGSARNSERLHAIESEISGTGHFFARPISLNQMIFKYFIMKQSLQWEELIFL